MDDFGRAIGMLDSRSSFFFFFFLLSSPRDIFYFASSKYGRFNNLEFGLNN